jgi:hypothetical protein
MRISVIQALKRWSQEQETALLQMTQRKTASARLDGFSKSKRVEAKFLLLGMAPMAPLAVSDALGLARGTFWNVWFWVSVIWLTLVVIVAFAAIWRAVRRAQRLKR